MLGDFAADDTDGVIPLTWVEAAIERWRQYTAQTPEAARPKASVIGADIARGVTRKGLAL